MKLLAVFSAVLALSAAYSPVAVWTLEEITAALSNPSTTPEQLPYLTNALNTIMSNLHAGEQQTSVLVSMPVTATVTLDELMSALHDPHTNPAVMPYLEQSLSDLMVAMYNGQEEDTITLHIPAMEVNLWTLEELSHALTNPETDPELHIYLEHALNLAMENIFAGNEVTEIVVVTPPGVIATVPTPVEIPAPVVVPEVPVIPEPIIITPVAPEIHPEPVIIAPEAPVIPEPEAPAPAVVPEGPAPAVVPQAPATSPLVQIIVNVNAKSSALAPVAPEAVAVPVEAEDPIAVQPTPVIDSMPEPIIAVGPWA